VKRKTPRRKHVPRVVVRKLGREKAWGIAHEDGLIELDPGLSGLAKLDVLLHEWRHVTNWDAPEKEVEKWAESLAQFLHKNNVRIIEAGDRLAP
jgi:hypothetical protein